MANYSSIMFKTSKTERDFGEVIKHKMMLGNFKWWTL